MISQAIARFMRVSPRKARTVVNLVRGRDAGEALQLLDFTPKGAASIIRKLLASAIANARVARPDVLMLALLAPALGLAFTAWRDGRRRDAEWALVLVGLATLAKGPVAPALFRQVKGGICRL